MPAKANSARNVIAVLVAASLIIIFEKSELTADVDHFVFWYVIPISLGLIGAFAVVGQFLARTAYVVLIPLLVGFYFLPESLAGPSDPDAVAILAYYILYWMFGGSVVFFGIAGLRKLLDRQGEN